MNRLNFPGITWTEIEGVLLGSLVLLCIWLWLRLRNQRKEIARLADVLNQSPTPSATELSLSGQLGELARSALNSVAEAELQSELATGTQKVQQVLLDQVNDALFIVNAFQEIRFANRAAMQLFDTPDFIGRPLIEVCLDHQFAETVELAQKTEGSIQDQVQLTNDNRTFLIEAGRIDQSYQIGEGAWLIIRDVSAELHTDRVRQDFVANASHELRTPLSIIKGYLEMMRGDPKQANSVRIMLKHTERLSRIVEDMLLISRIESPDGVSLQSKGIFDVGDCVYDMLEQLKSIIDSQKAKITVKLPEEKDQREFYGDRFYWDQIFFNLVENALKQNPTIGLKITVLVEKIDGRFEISVIDNGVGIPSADLTEIFKRFYRVDKSHAQTIKGTGLGLSIVKRAVEAHNGQISVTSQPGACTCFFISVPGPPANVLETAS